MAGFSFEVEARDGRARAGRLVTPHGEVETPVFMPVGTAGAVKAVLHRDLREIGARILLANTYHLMLRPGDALVAGLGGLHGFTGWDAPFLTDSGGYQVFSLAALRKLDEEGVRFQSHIDGTRTPALPRAVDGDPAEPRRGHRDGLRRVPARRRAARGRRRGHRAHDALGAAGAAPPTAATTSGSSASSRAGSTSTCARRAPGSSWRSTSPATRSAGSRWASPRRGATASSSTSTPSCPPTGPATSWGSGPRRTSSTRWPGASTCSTACCRPATPATASSSRSRGRLSIRNARYKDDPRPPDPDCACPTCRTASRAYLRHLHLAGEMGAATLMSIHNLFFYLDMMRAMRQSIRLCRFEEWRGETLRRLAAADQDGS